MYNYFQDHKPKAFYFALNYNYHHAKNRLLKCLISNFFFSSVFQKDIFLFVAYSRIIRE